MQKTNIGWTEVTWSPITGCTQLSDGCRSCYAKRQAERMHSQGLEAYRQGFRVTLHRDRFDEPLRWREPRTCFVCSMGDIFHPEVPDDALVELWGVMRRAYRHTFQVLTKRPERAAALSLGWSENIWMGATVESMRYVGRLDALRAVPARVRFVSHEPLLGPVEVPYHGIHWVIAGGENGPLARQMDLDWARKIRDRCLADGLPFFYKGSGARMGHGDDQLDGQRWNQSPRVEPRGQASLF